LHAQWQSTFSADGKSGQDSPHCGTEADVSPAVPRSLEARSEPECTSFAISKNRSATGEVIVGQNLNLAPAFEPSGVVLCLYPKDGPAIITWTLAGTVGQVGLNSAGLARLRRLPQVVQDRVCMVARETTGPHCFPRRKRLAVSPKKTLEGRLHPGLVVEGSTGTRPAEVRSLVSGIVEFTGGATNRVAVRDERAQLHQLANLQSIRVKLGQRVGAGEVVGAAAKACSAADGDDPDDDVGDPPGSGRSSPEPPDDGEPPADDDEPALLATYSSRLDWLDSAAGGFTGEGPGPAQARRVTGAAARALASQLNLVALTAAEAEGLGQELLARLEGKKTASSAARAAAMASYLEGARAVRAAAQTLANQAESLATRMEGN